MIVDCVVYEEGRRRQEELDLHAAFDACRSGRYGLVHPDVPAIRSSWA